jgi:hypothetical protein
VKIKGLKLKLPDDKPSSTADGQVVAPASWFVHAHETDKIAMASKVTLPCFP